MRPLLKRNGFTFKQLFVAHDRCAMKFGTDGILLGAWAPVAQARRVLDIGSGSALIVLLLARRKPDEVIIDAVELDADAAQQAQENVAQSPWAARIHVHAQDIAAFATDCPQRYSLIVSNPPYCPPDVDCATPQLIEEEGFFCVVLPEAVGENMIALAERDGWHLCFRIDVAE
ncbi:tRNA1(Val) (adenine(37)-N6)-methyltransferase|nr:tRNA1(Val) (adenine(37)-N6)-methyltransferase [Candidatus Pantoea persica]